MTEPSFRAVITIADAQLTPVIVETVRRVGGQAITVLRGRGRNLVAAPVFLGIPIESEREMLFLVVEADRAHALAREVHRAGDLDRPGRGLVVVLDLEQVYGFLPQARELSIGPEPGGTG